MYTLVSEGSSLCAELFRLMVMDTKNIEHIRPTEVVMGEYNISRLPALILPNRTVVYEQEIRELVESYRRKQRRR